MSVMSRSEHHHLLELATKAYVDEPMVVVAISNEPYNVVKLPVLSDAKTGDSSSGSAMFMMLNNIKICH